MLDLRHRIAVAVLLRRIEREPAVGRRVHVDVGAQPHRAALRPRSPVGHQLVAEQQRAVRRAQPRIAAGRALPHPRVVADERLVRRAAEILARDQAVRHVLAGKRLIVDVRRRLDELVAVHVPPDEPRAVCEAVREPRVGRQQQQMRAPAVARRDDERLRAVLDRLAGPILVDALCGHDRGAPLVERQPPDERAVVQHDLLRRHQLAEREVGRISRAGRTDLAARVVHAAPAAAAERRQVARHRQRRELHAALLGPGLQRLQVVGQRNRSLRVRLGPPVLGMRARLAAHVQPPLRFAVVPFELLPLDRPVGREAVHRLQPEILLGEPVARAAPVQRQAADRHRHRDDAVGLLILDVVVGPRVLAVPMARSR